MYDVYKIIDRKSDNVYVGITKDINHRMRQHRWSYKHKKQQCSAQQIFKNEDWFYEILEKTNDKSREMYWIQNTKNCINKLKYQGLDKVKAKEYQRNYSRKRYWNEKWGGLLSIDVESIFN